MVAPVNNAFADALQVDILNAGDTFTSSVGDDLDATWQTGEPVNTTVGGYRSTWWKYTPAHSGPVVVTKNSTGTINRIHLGVYTGALGSLVAIAEPSRLLNTAEFDALAGVTYYIRHSRYSTSYYGDAGITVQGETTVPSRPPATPTLTFVPEDTTLLVKWNKGFQVNWEVELNGGAPITVGMVGEHLFTGLTIGATYTVRVRGTNSFGTGNWGTRTIVLPNMLVFDSFSRAASSSVVGAGEVGPAPLSRVGTWGITSAQQLYPSAVSSNVAVITWECATPNVDIRVNRITPTDSGGICFGYLSTSEYWYVYFNGSAASTGGYLAYVRGGVVQQFVSIFGGPDIIGLQYRFVHNDGLFQVWAGTILLAEGELPYPDRVGTSHGVRSTANTHRWDDLTIRESGPITLEREGARPPVQQNLIPATPPGIVGFLYRGRDTKTQDTAGVA